jgi:DNA-binding LacI/PurR family transcriptional regulator/signal transduction histidine kinase
MVGQVRRPRIGVVINSLLTYFNEEMVARLRELAQLRNFDLLFLPGHRVNSPMLFERQFNVVYALGESAPVDGILCSTGFVQGFMTEPQSMAFVSRYVHLPTVSLHFAMPGCPSITVDNRAGFTDLMHHLIHAHGYGRIAFMRGPSGNADDEERFGVYRSCLQEAGLAFDPQLVVRGNFNTEDGRRAMLELLDRKLPFDALVAANDDMALSALAVAVERGFQIPQDFALTGFDDNVSVSKHGQSLTTVNQSIDTLVGAGVDQLLAQIQGAQVPLRTTIPTRLVVRQSCGCLAHSVPASSEADTTVLAALNLPPEEITEHLNYLAELTQALRADEKSFVECLRKIANRCLHRIGNVSSLQLLLLTIYQQHADTVGISNQDLQRAGSYLLKGQMVVANALNVSSLTAAALQHSSNFFQDDAGFLKKSACDSTFESVLDLIEESMHRSGIVSAYIAMYATPFAFQSVADCSLPTKTQLVFGMTNGVRQRDGLNALFPTQELLPNGVLGRSQDQVMTLCPIFQYAQHFGYVVFDLKSSTTLDMEAFREEISTFLVHAVQLKNLQQTQAQLVQSEKLASLGSLVAGVSHELNTPIGNCVTMCSTLNEATRVLGDEMARGTVTRNSLTSYIEFSAQGLDLMSRGLGRSVKLLEAFKQTAVDQVSEKRRIFEIQDTIDGVVSLMRASMKKSAVQIVVDLPAGVEMDSFPGALEQIISNLINNSFVHGFDGREHGTIRLQATASEETLHLRYSDDGLGMSAHVLEHLFDPFFTTRLGQGGNGLGMNICYNLVVGPLGGSIQVSSTQGKGSLFEIHLPLQAPRSTA